MKKNYFKKSLSLVMAVLMVLSCWVWIAPEHAEAYSASDVYTSLDDIKSKNNTLLGQVTGSTEIKETYGKYFQYDIDKNVSVTEEQYKAVYKNLIWSDIVSTNSGGAISNGKVVDDKDIEQLAFYYPTTVLMYDGSAPSMGVSLLKDANSTPPASGDRTLYHYGTEITSPTSLKIKGEWHTKSGSEETGNGKPYFFYTWNGGNNNAGYNYTGTKSDSSYHGGSASKWYYLSNIIEYVDDGTLAGDTYSRTLTPTFYSYLGRKWGYKNKNQKEGYATVKATRPIYIIKTDTLKAAYKQVDTLKSEIQNNPQKYTPASVEEFKNLANALTAANPNNTSKFNWADTANAVDKYAKDAEAAVNAWNAWYKDGKGGLVEIKEIKWNDGNGKTIKTEYCGVDQTASYSGTTPTKKGSGYYDETEGYQVTYTFNEDNPWTKAESVDSTTKRKIETYTANFDSKTNYYVIKFVHADDDQTTITKLFTPDYDMKPNDIPAFTYRQPTKDGHEANYWSPEIGKVTSDKTYREQIGTAPHTYDGTWVVTKEATCKEEGSKYQVCTTEKCKYVDTVTIEKKSHNLTKVDAVASTCTVQGNITYWYCSVCKTYYKDEKCEKEDEIEGGLAGTKLELAGHSFSKYTKIEGDEEYHTAHCTNEGCTATDIVIHEYRPQGMASTATCVTPGRTPMRCVCGMTKLQDGDVDPNNHENIVVINAEAPTCDDEGYTGDKVCLACDPNGDKILEAGKEIPALGHKFDGDYVSNNNGTHVQKCKNENCDATGNLMECTYSDWTIDNAETHSHTCTACNYTPTAEPHNWSAWTPVDENAATASKMTRTCSVCNATDTTDCTYDSVYTAPTCTQDAYTTYTCKDENCGHTYKVIGDPALGHDYTGTIIDNGNGTHSYLCKNGCGTYGATVDCSNWVADGNNCKCSDCGYTKAHAWGKWVNNSDNVADAPGKMTRTCSVCNATDTTDCTYDSVYTAPTCTQDAYTTYTCKDENCGHGYTVIDKGSATGHNFTGEYKFDATADKHQQLCDNGCGTYGVGTTAGEWADCSWSYTNKESGKHTATCVCGNSEEQTCSGGEATCTAKAECQYCKTAYGEKSDHSFSGTPVALEGDFHAYRCKFCKDTTIYGVGSKEGISEPCSGGSATCTTLATCKVCGDTHGQLDADAHKWAVPPVSNGDAAHTHTYTCEYNSEHKKTEPCTPEVAEVVAPTCEEAGYTVQKCTACSATWNTDPTDALGHEWGQWVNNGNGTHTKTCVRVGCCYGENGDAKTETTSCTKENATVVVTAPTCTEQGFSTYTCKDCGYVWVADYVDALGHDYTKKIYREEYLFDKQNCTQGNIYFYACSRCGKNGRDETDTNKYTNLKFEADKPLGHKWVEKIADEYKMSDADCTTAAKYYKSCEVCKITSEGTEFEATFTVTEAFGHSNWVKPTAEEIKAREELLAVKADCETDAQYYYVCERCRVSSKGLKTDGETWTVVSDKPGHSTLIEVKGVVGNCENDTIIAHYYCSACGKKFKDANGNEAFVGATVIKAPGHSWVKYKAVDATCETDGHDAYDMCSVCDAVKGSTVKYPKTGHNFTADAGYYVDEVNDCHAYYCANAKCIPATDDNGEAIKDAKGRSVYNKAYGAVVDGVQVKYSVTDNGDGTVTVSGGFKCSFDDSTVTTVNGVHSHNDVCVCGNSISVVYTDETPETIAPTCVDNGYKLHVCPACNAEWKTDMVEPNGHTWSTTGTSNGDGTHSLHCTVENCGYKKDTVRCEGGTATCKDKAICDICGGGYGDTLPHTLSDSGWSYNNDAKCGKDGTESQNCSVCGKTVTRTKAGSALNHVYLPEYTYDITGWTNKPADFNLTIKEPNCKENGLAINYCTNDGCGHYNTKIVKASSIYHKITETTIAGTCTTGAKTIKSCSVCDYTETITSQASDHKWTETSREVPDCTNSGAIHFYCTACGETAKLSSFTVDFTDSDYVMFMGMEVNISGIKALGHQWGNLEIEKAPTCSREGRGEHTCNVCKKTEIVDIAPIEGAHIIGHKNSTLKKVPASAPTCVLSGNREYYECMSCPYSQNANDEYYLKPLNHKDGDGDGRCDTCYDPMGNTSVIKDDCICHKTGFSAFIYKILRVFWKLFKMKPTCECGAAHY